MARMSLQTLPPEVFQVIAQLLADDHPPSLLKLACANKTYFAWCLPATKSVFFHDIRVSYNRRWHLKEAVKSVMKKLKRADAFRHVRRLIIAPRDDLSFSDAEWKPPKLSALRVRGRPNQYDTQYARVNSPPIHRPPVSIWTPGQESGLLDDESDPDAANNEWQPVVDLIRSLPELKDLVYRCFDQFPPLLLDALQRDRPRCRLHIHSFWLFSLDAPKTNASEFQLMRSPLLHSIMVRCPLERAQDSTQWSQEDVALRVLELAPNLKKAHILYERNFYESDEVTRPRWKGFTQEEPNVDHPLGSLASLSLRTTTVQGEFKSRKLAEWSQYTDLSVLQNLEIGPVVDDAFFARCSQMGMSFSSLKTLALKIRPRPERFRTAQFYDEARRFLEGLPPLAELSLAGWHSLIPLESIVDVHGSHLRKLQLEHMTWKCLNEREIRLIGENCPHLEEFSTRIRRTMGDAREVALYRALATIRRLKHLSLAMDTSPIDLCKEEDDTAPSGDDQELDYSQVPNDPSFNVFDSMLCTDDQGMLWARNGHIRQLIINTVIDDDLGRAIFNTISSAKPPFCPRLESLSIETVGLDRRLAHVIAWFHLPKRTFEYSFACCKKEIIIREPVSWEKTSLQLLAERETYPLPPWLDTIFHRIWPRKGKTRPPRKQSAKLEAKRAREERNRVHSWSFYLKSFPLAMDT